jgi:hypothetical protein
MWHYNDAQRFRQPAQPGGSAQSAYDLLLGLRGVAVTLLFLDLTNPERPVTQLSGFIEDVRTTSLALGLTAPLPRVSPKIRYGVEVMVGPGIQRFQTVAYRPATEGDIRIELALPRQIESVQRRKFSRAPFSTAVAFSPDPARETAPAPTQSGVGQATDLSAGGLRLVTTTPLKYGDQLFVSFHTPDGLAYRGLPSRVVRVASDGLRYTVGLHFADLDEPTENSLAQSVFKLQLRGVARR